MLVALFVALAMGHRRGEGRRGRHSARRRTSRENGDRFLSLLPGDADDIDGAFLIPKSHNPDASKALRISAQREAMRDLTRTFDTKEEISRRLLTATRQALAEEESYLHEALLNMYARLQSVKK